MKLYTFFFLCVLAFAFTGCEDVIDVNLNTAKPKLVIDASIQWAKGTTGSDQTIRLTTTTGYFDSTIPTVSGADVYITNSDNAKFTFTENTPNTGIYACDNFTPEIDKEYTLTVVLNGETYTASETLKSVAPITRIEQKNEGGFSGTDIQVKTFFNDPADEENYYLFQYKTNISIIPSYDATNDEFFNGNEFFGLYSNKDLKPGNELNIKIYGISERYFDYMSKLINIAGNTSGSPFSTPPATVRGNITNQTNAKNYALGYFTLSETDFRNYLIE